MSTWTTALLGSILLVAHCGQVAAETRLALLVGNGKYNENVGKLTNPENDIEIVGKALAKLGFKVTTIQDASFEALHKAFRTHTTEVSVAGKDAISFIYYSGHGASDLATQTNYLLPVDVPDGTATVVWNHSIELKADVLDKLMSRAPTAIHFVVFDACRTELKLKFPDRKAFEVDGKGFVANALTAGPLVAFATQPGRTASDFGQGGGPYARALAEELVRPGIEAVTMFRNVQLRVKQSIGQDPWLSVPSFPEVYLAGTTPAPSGPAPDLGQGPQTPDSLEVAFARERASIKASIMPVLSQLDLEGIKSSGVLNLEDIWPSKHAIRMCFMDGQQDLRSHVAFIARQWTLYGAIDFDFGNLADPRMCTGADRNSEVRITFNTDGNWAYLGVKARAVPANQPTLSMNSLKDASVVEIKKSQFYSQVILHEFGHVLGFGHNWSGPTAGCDTEMNWPQIYKELAISGWSKDMIDAQWRHPNSNAGTVGGAFDKSSIMNYSLPESWYFKGRESRCFLEPKADLSLRDKLAVFTNYK